MKILVTGGAGLLGKSLRDIKPEYVYLSKDNGDLRNAQVIAQILDAEKPDKIVHAAAVVGGIQDNVRFPYKYFTDNVQINTNLIDAAVAREIPVVAISSTCVFPKDAAKYPLTEDAALSGEPEPTNYGYAFSKRVMQIQLQQAFAQFSHKSAVLFLANLYGEHDHFNDDGKAHLVTALLKKMHAAKINGDSQVNLLGTGKPLRQFLYAKDAARAIINVIESDIYDVFNICGDENLSVREIAETVKIALEYNGELAFNGKLDGVFRKDATAAKLKNHFPELEFMPLKYGVKTTYDIIKNKL